MRHERPCLIYICVSLCVAWSLATAGEKGGPSAEESVGESDQVRAAGDLYHEAYRPQFHFTAKNCWIADPEALVHYDGEYHLFYLRPAPGKQEAPYEPYWWGHAISRDLLHWRDLGVALEPDAGNANGLWSGGAVVDGNNTSGLQTGREKVLVAFYTRTHSGACVFFSNDKGRTWRRYKDNPVLPVTKNNGWNDRDPKVIWHEPTQRWVMVRSESGSKKISFYGSANLLKWEYLSSLDDQWADCPDFFPLLVDGVPGKVKWVLLFTDATGGRYLVGEFDGKIFRREGDLLTVDWGSIRATQSWSDVPDGRRIHIAWLEGEGPGMGFKSQYTIPCELSLRQFPEGIRLCRQPIREVETLRGREHRWDNVVLKPGENPLAELSGDLWDMVAEVEFQGAGELCLKVRGEPICYSFTEKQVSFLGKTGPLEPVANRVKMRVLVDRSSIELFGNDGKLSMTSYFTPEQADTGLALYTTGGTAIIVSLDVYELCSIWHERAQAEVVQ